MNININHLRKVAEQTQRALEPFEEHPWEAFHENVSDYQQEILRSCASAFSAISRTAWLSTKIAKNSVLFPVATYYVNSHVLKTRIACPCQPFPYVPFRDFFQIYSRQVARPDSMKRVFGLANNARDHLIGLLTHRTVFNPDTPIVLTVHNSNIPPAHQSTLHFSSHLQTSTEALTNGIIRRKDLISLRRQLRKIVKPNTTGFSDSSVARMVGPPLQFISYDAACRIEHGDTKLPSLPFYEVASFKWPTSPAWKAVHYIYISEQPAFPSSSGAVLLLVETQGHTLNNNIVDTLEKDTIPLVRAGMCLGIAHVVARCEERIMASALSHTTNGAHITYPDDFAVQQDTPAPQMPLMERIIEIQSQTPFKSLRPQMQTVAECLRYLVQADTVLTSGYATIVVPILHCVKKLWFLFGGTAPGELDEAVEQWNASFRKTMAAHDGDLDKQNGRLLQVLSLALGIEHDLADIPSYREHFVHSFHVYCLGLCLLSALAKRHAAIRKPKKMAELAKKWFFVAFWHDTGYAVEKLESLSNRYVAAIRRKKPSGHSDFYKVPFNPSFGHLLVSDGFFAEIQDAKSKYLTRDTYMRLFAPNDVDVLQRVVRRQLISRAQHGVLSALVFLRDADELQSAHDLSEVGIGEIAMAIALHHIDATWFETDPKDAGKQEREFKRRTDNWRRSMWKDGCELSTLLVMSDIMAQWGRNFEYADSEPCLLEALTLKGKKLEITMRYPKATVKRVEEGCSKWYRTPFSTGVSGGPLLEITLAVGEDSHSRSVITPKIVINSGIGI